MKKIIEIINLYWKYILAIIIILGFVIYLLVVNDWTNKKKNVIEDININKVNEANISVNNSTIFVDIKGSVKNPGVYELEAGSRVINAIEKSGGLTNEADTSIINLSKKLEDGNVIIIYTKNKIAELTKQDILVEYIEKECQCPEEDNVACLDKNDIVYEEVPVSDSLNVQGKISLNNASKEELTTLPGIGESKANDILNYIKENGKFKNVEDIKNVKGIGDALFNKIKEYIKI